MNTINRINRIEETQWEIKEIEEFILLLQELQGKISYDCIFNKFSFENGEKSKWDVWIFYQYYLLLKDIGMSPKELHETWNLYKKNEEFHQSLLLDEKLIKLLRV